MPDTRDSDPKNVREFRLIRNRSAEGQLLSSIALGSLGQIVIAVAAIFGICYAAKLPLITLFVAILIAFILAPIATLLERWRLPRWASSLISVALLIGCLYGLA